MSQNHEIIVIGSGPGGAITACLLAEAGKDVLLIEDGAAFKENSIAAFSLDEIQKKYRNHGYTLFFGNPKIPYVEGRCVGGGSEINSGLYHRTPQNILTSWIDDFGLEDFSIETMEDFFIANERDLTISLLNQDPPLPSQLLRDSAKDLGWAVEEVPRWISQRLDPETHRQAINRRSMSTTFIPRFIRAGGHLLTNTKADKVKRVNGVWHVDCLGNNHQENEVSAKYLFVCAGAVQTPFLLQKSGIKKNIGKTFKAHPMLKVIGEFQDPVNNGGVGVPMHQVTEFLPEFTLGSSIGSKPFLGLGLMHYPQALKQFSMRWQHMVSYHVTIHSETNGSIMAFPGFKDPWVRYTVSEHDLALLAKGHSRLLELLFNANAIQTYSNIKNHPSFSSYQAFLASNTKLTKRNIELSAVHIMGSCPMGKDAKTSATNAFGKVHNTENLYINDASLFCSSIGVNPQGTVMALARRNVSHFLKTL